MASVNDQLVLLAGKSTTGKSHALMGLKDPAGVLYLNTESGKRLPFKSGFQEKTITDPLQIYEAFTWAEDQPTIHTIIIDSLTYLLDMYETMYIYQAVDGQKAWGEFAHYFRALMQQYVASSTKSVIFTAHTLDILNKTEMAMETRVPVKGALKNNGIESWFSTVIASKKVTLKDLEPFSSDLLTITDREKVLGFKYVFQTQVTKATLHESLRGPLDLFTVPETYTDNNIQLVLDRLTSYYN